VDWDAAYEAVSENVSPEGMAILQDRLATSERILIGLDWEGQMMYVPAEVRHCQSRALDMVDLGCQFQIAPMASATQAANVDRAIRELIDKIAEQALVATDRRTHPRAAYNSRVSIQVEPNQEPVLGFSRDLSKGGISFLTTTPLNFTEVIVSLPQTDRAILRVVARIVRCNQLMAGIYDVAARFLDVAESLRH
jgi:hypothetical protein